MVFWVLSSMEVFDWFVHPVLHDEIVELSFTQEIKPQMSQILDS